MPSSGLAEATADGSLTNSLGKADSKLGLKWRSKSCTLMIAAIGGQGKRNMRDEIVAAYGRYKNASSCWNKGEVCTVDGEETKRGDPSAGSYTAHLLASAKVQLPLRTGSFDSFGALMSTPSIMTMGRAHKTEILVVVKPRTPSLGKFSHSLIVVSMICLLK